MGPFKFSISKEAEKVDLDKIPAEKRDILTKGINFDPAVHDIYLFHVAPEFIQNPKGKKRVLKRRDYSIVDRIFIRTKMPTDEIKVCGMYPVSRSETILYDHKINSYIPIIGSLRAEGKAKDLIRQGEYHILANRTDNIAQWIFLKPYIQQHVDFGMKILCIVPKKVDPDYRYMHCYVAAKEGTRIIENPKVKRITFPLN